MNLNKRMGNYVTHATRRTTHYGKERLQGSKIHNAFVNRNYTVKY
ncbi:hypothetical protein ACVQ92_07250 [Staphylococcus aureus]